MKKINFAIISAIFMANVMLPQALAVSTANAKTYDISLTVNGIRVYMLNEQMESLPALFYNNSYYISLRTAGEWLGKDVSWNGDIQTISLSGTEQPKYYTSKDIKGVVDFKYGEDVNVTKRDDIKILIDGEQKEFYNQLNQHIYPVMYNNSTYLPVRNIAEILNMEIEWQNATEETAPMISLSSKLSTDENKTFEEYKNTVINELEKYTDLAAGLYPNKSNNEQLKSILSDMEKCLNNVLALNPNIPSKQNVIDAIKTAVKNNLTMIDSAYSAMETETIDELFAIKHGQAKGILMKLNTSEDISNIIIVLKNP